MKKDLDQTVDILSNYFEKTIDKLHESTSNRQGYVFYLVRIGNGNLTNGFS